MKKIKVMSVFSGVGGLEQGLDHDKFDVVGHSEINKASCLILNYHYPQIKNYGDITKIESDKLPKFDMLVGGSPCQNLSMAGNKKGLQGTKSSLFFTFVKLLKENNPEYFIWENVKGTFYSGKGFDFFAVQKHFHDAGYHIQWQLLNSEDFGVSQVRNRVFVVGVKNKKDLPGLIKIINSSKTKNMSLKFSHFCGVLLRDGIVSTITASYGALAGNGTKIIEGMEPTKENLKAIVDSSDANKSIRLLTHIEAERLMGWGDDWTKYGTNDEGKKVNISERERYKAIGNGIVSNCVKVLTGFFNFSDKVFIENKSLLEMSSYTVAGTDIQDSKKNIENHKDFLKKMKLIENVDFVSKGKKIYITNFRFIDAIANNESAFKAEITELKHPTMGILDLDKSYIKTDMNEYKSLKDVTKLESILEKSDSNKRYLSKKECAYILSRMK